MQVNEIISKIRQGVYSQEVSYLDSSCVYSTKHKFYMCNELWIRIVNDTLVFYKRINAEWSLITPEEKSKLEEATKMITFEPTETNIPDEIIALFIAWDIIREKNKKEI